MKNVFIIGMSRGIGLCLAKEFKKRNYLVGGCSRGEADYKVDFYERADITEKLEMEKCLQKFHRLHGDIDIFIINAGINHFYPPHDDNFKAERKVIEVNVLGPLLALEILGEHTLLKPSQSKVVLLGSVAAARGLWGSGAYCASKAAIKAIWEAYKKPFLKKNIELQLLEPGFVATAMIGPYDYPKPFLISSEKFAHKAVKRILAGEMRMTVPRRAHLLKLIMKFTPLWLLEGFQARLDYYKFFKK